MYLAYSAMVDVAFTLAATSTGGSLAGAIGGDGAVVGSVRGIIHKPVRVHFLPQMIVRPR
jgi:hypothetical protein